LENTIA
jgi:hypothetical protein